MIRGALVAVAVSRGWIGGLRERVARILRDARARRVVTAPPVAAVSVTVDAGGSSAVIDGPPDSIGGCPPELRQRARFDWSRRERREAAVSDRRAAGTIVADGGSMRSLHGNAGTIPRPCAMIVERRRDGFPRRRSFDPMRRGGAVRSARSHEGLLRRRRAAVIRGQRAGASKTGFRAVGLGWAEIRLFPAQFQPRRQIPEYVAGVVRRLYNRAPS